MSAPGTLRTCAGPGSMSAFGRKAYNLRCRLGTEIRKLQVFQGEIVSQAAYEGSIPFARSNRRAPQRRGSACRPSSEGCLTWANGTTTRSVRLGMILSFRPFHHVAGRDDRAARACAVVDVAFFHAVARDEHDPEIAVQVGTDDRLVVGRNRSGERLLGVGDRG